MDRRRLRSNILIITYMVLLVALLIKLDFVIDIIGQFVLLLSPLFVGGIIAFIFKRPYDALTALIGKLFSKKREKLSQAVALILLYCAFFALFAIILSIVIPQLAESSMMFTQTVEALAPAFSQWVQTAQDNISGLGIDISQYADSFKKIPDMIGRFLIGAMPQLFSVTNSVVRSVANIVMGLVFSVYLLICRKSLSEQSRRVLRAFCSDKTYNAIMHTANVANKTFTKFVSGQLTEAFILGGLCFVGLSFLRLEYALMISVLIGVTSLVPIVGAFIGAVPSAFLLLMLSPRKALVFIVFLIVLQQFEGNVIYPKVVGGSIGLPALWILLAITVGGGMFGVLGMLLAVPVTSVLYQLFGELVENRLKAKEKN